MSDDPEKETTAENKSRCTCWHNKRGEVIYVEQACPDHGKEAYGY